VVGFFGEKKKLSSELSHALAQIDEKLVEVYFKVPDALSYYSLELEEGNWGNLVLMSGDESVKETWRIGDYHRVATGELSPQIYNTIRLHNGYLPAGMNSSFQFQRTKLYDYREGGIPYSVLQEEKIIK